MNRTLEQLPIAALVADGIPGAAFTSGNRAWRSYAGNVGLDAALHPDDRDGAQLSIRTGLIVGADFALEARLRGANGNFARYALQFSLTTTTERLEGMAEQQTARPTAAGESAPPAQPSSQQSSQQWVAIATDIDAFLASHAHPQIPRPSPSSAPTVTLDLQDFRGQMAGIIGHDLRNPLSTLVMGTALLRARLKTEAELKLVDRLIKASDRMTRMIAQLVDYSAIRLGGTLDVAPEAGDLVPIVRHAVEEIATARSLVISIDTPETITGEWDTRRVEQVVTNLVLNAVIHGAPRFSVSLVASDSDAILEVRDHGPALDESVLGQVFSANRKRISTTREAGSLGLGLFVTEQIVQAHGGKITARSNAEGTVFRVELPRTARPHDPSNPG